MWIQKQLTKGVVATSNNAVIVCFLQFNTLFPCRFFFGLRQGTIDTNGKSEDHEEEHQEKRCGVFHHTYENDDKRSESFAQGENPEHPKPHH